MARKGQIVFFRFFYMGRLDFFSRKLYSIVVTDHRLLLTPVHFGAGRGSRRSVVPDHHDNNFSIGILRVRPFALGGAFAECQTENRIKP
jgi:hypothetical protein